jgi:hypothetical protein
MLIPTIIMAVVIAATIGISFAKHHDTFHPAMLLGPMLAFHYCYSPAILLATDGFSGFLSADNIARVQWIDLVGVAAICAGLLAGSARPSLIAAPPTERFDRKTLLFGSIAFGLAGTASFASGIANVGGITEAYGSAYGGGWSESGWVRDLVLLCLPAVMMLTLSNSTRKPTIREILMAVLIASPFLIHGLLGARRGPTFLGLGATIMSFYISRGKRPRILTMSIGGALLGMLLLVLVSNRETLYWGGDLKLERGASEYFRPGTGNDFIYGAGLVVVTDEMQDFSWGATYLTTLFVRPIPKAIWPDKYDDAAAFFGRPSLAENLGIDIRSFRNVLGWTAAVGSAPGIVGDMWREFSWGMVVMLFGIGWWYAFAWQKAVVRGGEWLPVYCLLASLSLYMVMQTLEAVLYRFIFAVVPMLWVLRRAARNQRLAVERALAANLVWNRDANGRPAPAQT